MALFRIFKGNSANLPEEKHDGYCYFTTDDGIFYIDYLDSDGTTTTLRRRPISGPGNSIEYIVGTQTAKTGSWTGVTKDPSLAIGKTIAYKLPYAGNGSASLTLTFTNPTGADTTGAIAVYTNTSRVTTHYGANSVILLTYDGTYWRASEYWNSNSRDPGYGKITPGAASTSAEAITANTTQIAAGTYNENLNINPGNKWVQIGATSGASNGGDTLTLGHALSDVTAGTSSPNTAQTPSFNSTFNIPTVTVDEAGHVTAMGTTTVKIPAQTNLSGGSATANDKTVVGGVTVSGHAITVAKKTMTEGAGISITGATDKITIAHSNSVTAGTAKGEDSKTLTFGGTFTIPTVTYDGQGHVTGKGTTTMTMPANPNTDITVKQTEKTDNVDYKILTTVSASPTSGSAAEAGYGANLAYNPSTNTLKTGNASLTGTLNVTGQTILNDNLNAQGVTATDLMVTGNSNFVQIPTAPTAAAGTSNTQLATTAFVANAVSQGFAANDAMVFKGTVSSNNELPKNGYSAGWTYRVDTAGTYAGEYCEVGDILIAVNDGPSSGSSVIAVDWAKIEHNIDGALYKTNAVAYTGDKVLMSSGTSGAVKEGTISTVAADDITSWSAGTLPTLGTAIAADDITSWSAGSLPTLGTAIAADDITSWSAGSVPTLGTAIAADDITSWNAGTTPTLGTAIAADDITSWNQGSLPALTITEEENIVNSITWSAGTKPTLTITATACDDITAWDAGTIPALTITATACDDITAWTSNTPTSAAVSDGVLTITTGAAASLSYTARSVGSASDWSAGTVPSLSYTARSVGSASGWSAGTLSSLAYDTVTIGSASEWSAGSLPSLGYTARSIPNVTSVGTVPTLEYTARSIPNVTSVGTVPTLEYTARSIPNITAVGSLPDLKYTARSIPNVTGVGTLPDLKYTARTVVSGIT